MYTELFFDFLCLLYIASNRWCAALSSCQYILAMFMRKYEKNWQINVDSKFEGIQTDALFAVSLVFMNMLLLVPVILSFSQNDCSLCLHGTHLG